jgi:ribosomal protein L5
MKKRLQLKNGKGNHYEIFQALRGFQITFMTTAKSSQETALLLSGYQIPFV